VTTPTARGRTAPPVAGTGGWRDRGLRLLVELPDRLPVLLACLALTALLAVMAGELRPVVVVPVAAALAVLTWRAVPALGAGRRARPGAARADRWAVVALLVLVAVWLLVSARFVADYVVVNRDPGFLTLEGLWLRTHPSAPIPVGGAAAVQAAVPLAKASTQAFDLAGGELHAQGDTMLPALLATFGWVGGEDAVVGGNLMVGAVGLLAVFAAARRWTGSLWALVPTGALALCLPFLVFTRAAYSEPLVVALAFGALAVLHGALAGRSWRAFALGGGLVGVAAASRIDGALLVLALAVALGAVGWAAVPHEGRRALVRGVAVAVCCAAVVGALGILDVRLLSHAYARQQAAQLRMLVPATVAGVVVVLALLAWPRPTRRLRRLLLRRRRAVGTAGAVLVGLAVLALASRPLWLVSRHNTPGTGVPEAVAALQKAEGLAVDPLRSYDEHTVSWLAWYVGWPVVAAAAVGLALLVRRAVVRRDPAAWTLAAVVVGGSLLYLWRASITPDQLWAVRRFLPVTIPGLLVVAGWVVVRLWDRGRRVPQVLGVALAGVMLATPVLAWHLSASTRDLDGRRAQAEAVCAELAAHDVHRVVWVHSAPFRYLATLRVLCDVEVVELTRPPSAAQLAAVRAAWGPGDVAAVSFDLTDLPWADGPGQEFAFARTVELGRSLVGPPTADKVRQSAAHGGIVRPDGHVAAFAG